MLFNGIQFAINLKSISKSGTDGSGSLLSGDGQAFESTFAQKLSLLSGSSTVKSTSKSGLAGLIKRLKGSSDGLSIEEIAGAKGVLSGLATGTSELSFGQNFLELLTELAGQDVEGSGDVTALLEAMMENLASTSDSDALLSVLSGLFSNELEDLKGFDWIEKFKEILELSGQDLAAISIDEDGLDSLEDLLVQAGFSRDDIDTLLSDLTDTSGDGSVNLSEFLTGVMELTSAASEDDEKEQTDLVLPISVLPVIETILAAFGIPENVRSELLSEAGQNNEGIELNTLISKFQSYQKQLALSSTSLTAGDQGASLETLLGQLGIGNSYSGSGDYRFQDFLVALEEVRDTIKTTIDKALKAGTNLSGATLSTGSAGPVITIGAIEDDNATGTVQSLLSKVLSNMESTSSISGTGQVSQQETSSEFAYNVLKSEATRNPAALISALSATASKHAPDTTAEMKAMNQDLNQLLNRVEVLVSSTAKTTSVDETAAHLKSTLVSSSGKKGKQTAPESVQPSSGSLKWSDMGSASSKTSTARTPSSILPSYVANQVGKRLIQSINLGQTEMKLQLKPPELGRIIVTIDTHETGMKVNIVTENQAARDILASQSADLKTTLSNSGINLESFDVEMGSDFQQSMADARYQSGQSGAGKNKFGKGAGMASGTAGADDVVAIDQMMADGAFHFVA